MAVRQSAAGNRADSVSLALLAGEADDFQGSGFVLAETITNRRSAHFLTALLPTYYSFF